MQLVRQGKSTITKKKKTNAVPEASGLVKEKNDNENVIYKSGKPIRKPPKGNALEDLQTGKKEF